MRYLKAPVSPEPPIDFAWDKCLENRKRHLIKMLALNAPEYVTEMACRNFLKAIARQHKSRYVLWRWFRHDFGQWWHMLKFDLHWAWYCRVLRHSQQEAERYFFGDVEDPEEMELRKMAGLQGEKQ